jgi:hypothetical protein
MQEPQSTKETVGMYTVSVYNCIIYIQYLLNGGGQHCFCQMQRNSGSVGFEDMIF